MNDLRTLIAQCREIEKAATPGPWHEESEGPEVQAIYGPKGAFHHVLWARICDACAKHGGTCTAASPADSALLTTARNLFAALLDVAEAVDKQDGKKSPHLLYRMAQLREAMEANRGQG